MFRFQHPRSGDYRLAKMFWSRLGILKGQPELAARGKYTIVSNVDPEVVDMFFMRVTGDPTPVVTEHNAEQLRALCDELGFAGFDHEIRTVLGGTRNGAMDALGLRGRVDRHDVIIEELQRRVFELERQVRGQRGIPERVDAVERRVQQHCSDVEGAVDEARREVDNLRKSVQQLRCVAGEKANAADVAALSDEIARLKDAEAKQAPQTKCLPVAPLTPKQKAKATKNVPDKVEIECYYSKAKPLDGIIAYLSRVCRGNVHERGLVEVTSSSCFCAGCEPENAADLESGDYFQSNWEPSPWICYDFMDRRVTVDCYSIRSYDRGPGNYHPKSWVLEVSNDGSERSWRQVDTRDDNFDLNARDVTQNFEVRNYLREAFRFVRLRQTGKNHGGDDNLLLCSLELFGSVIQAYTPHPAGPGRPRP